MFPVGPLEKAFSELISSIEIAKVQCMPGGRHSEPGCQQERENSLPNGGAARIPVALAVVSQTASHG